MSRRLIVGLSIGLCTLVALFAGGVLLILKSGLVQVVSNVSTGEADERESPEATRRSVGYVGRVVPRGALGSLTEGKIDSSSESPKLLVPGGTQVKVLAAGKGAAQIEILEGSERGMKPWIHWRDLG